MFFMSLSPIHMNSVFNGTDIRKLGCNRMLYDQTFKRISDFSRSIILRVSDYSWVNNTQITQTTRKRKQFTFTCGAERTSNQENKLQIDSIFKRFKQWG